MKTPRFLAGLALATATVIALPAIADPEFYNPPTGTPFHGADTDNLSPGSRAILREMAKEDGDPDGTVAVPHLHPQAPARAHLGFVRNAPEDPPTTERSYSLNPKEPLDMSLYHRKPE